MVSRLAPIMMSVLRIFLLLLCVYGAMGGLVFMMQRSLLYHPTHRVVETIMEPWSVEGEPWGFVRAVANPSGAWLILHGNGGQAAHRDYLIERVAADTVVYIVEYPGYGARPGMPTKHNINEAAAAAWRFVRECHPDIPIGVMGESIGSGPASSLVQTELPPDKVVLLVPFDRLSHVAAKRFWWLPVRWLMRDDWDNVASLRDYRGAIEIYAARDDEIIPGERAEALAAAYPQARFVLMEGGHNSWQWSEQFVLPAPAGVALPAPSSVQ